VKRCPSCNAKNRSSAQFCTACSAPLVQELVCSSCGTVNPVTARYCNYCAGPLQATVGHPTLAGMLPPNALVEKRYAIIHKLGEGGMGAVYLVKDTRLGNRKCALKEMSDAPITNPVELQQAKEAFQREAEILSTLSHPALPRVTDFFSVGSKHYLVMDYADGRPLDELLVKRVRPFPESQVMVWAQQVCEVFSYLHSQDPPIIYRDLKPANIMLTTNRKSLKLIDFGIARTYKPHRPKDTIAMGTPGYSPPEQYGKGQTDHRSDIYALGATLHHLLTLRDPGDEPFRFPEVTSLNPGVSAEMNQVIMKAVEQDRTKRWQSVTEMARFFGKPAAAVQPASPPIQVPVPKVPATAPVTTSTGVSPSHPSQTSLLNLPASQWLWHNPRDFFKRIYPRLKNWIAAKLQSKFLRGYLLWVILFGVGGVYLKMLLEDTFGIGSWGFSGEILAGILLSLPFLLSAIFVKRIGAVSLTVLINNLLLSGLGLGILVVAVCSELPFLVTRYKNYTYTLLFTATLLNGVGVYAYFVFVYNYFLPFDYLIKSSIVSFLSPLIILAVGGLTDRL
jgi:serine/threonine-protein kinase